MELVYFDGRGIHTHEKSYARKNDFRWLNRFGLILSPADVGFGPRLKRGPDRSQSNRSMISLGLGFRFPYL